MADRPAIMEAKLNKLAEIMADGNKAKRNMTVDEARRKQREAAREVLEGDHATPASVEDIALPSER